MAIQFKEYFKGDTISQSNITFREFGKNALPSYTTLTVNNSSSWTATLNIYKTDTAQTDFYVDDVLQKSSTTSGSQDIPLSITSGTHIIKIDGGSFYFDSFCLGFVPNPCLSNVNLGNNYGSIIGLYTFLSCEKLTSAVLSDNIISINNSAFTGCSKLLSIIVPGSVTSIGEGAFACNIGESSLTSVLFKDGSNELSIGRGAFTYNSVLTELVLPQRISNIGENAFANCTALTSITIKRITPPTISTSVFNNTNNCPIYVPAESVGLYKSATNWSTYASRIQAIQE